MDNFYKLFIEEYFATLREGKFDFKSNLGFKLQGITKLIYHYERVMDTITSLFGRGKVTGFFFYPNNYFTEDIQKFEPTFNAFRDNESRKKFVQYIVYNALKSKRVKLKFDTGNILKKLDEIETLQVSKHVNYSSNIGHLNSYKLHKIGYEATVINNHVGLLIEYMYEQYAYKDLVTVKEGDIVIDCGAAIGDTAIYFASKGARRVLAVEFIQSNIDVIEKQLELNQQFTDIIDIIKNPLWDESDLELTYMDRGNSSRVSFGNDYPNKIKSICIDDFAADINIDFIKMDIEGAELPALKGAATTIKKNKPKLAISVYHKIDDLVKIPQYIKSLNDDYDFYFDYYTDIGWEAVLYAIDRKST